MQRVERDLASGDHNEALANLAELAEIARRLWNNLATTVYNTTEDELARWSTRRPKRTWQTL
jgi:hypothetical protein